MNSYVRSAFAAATLAASLFSATFSQGAAKDETRSKTELEAATRLQVFLDRAEFAPGKIDGRYGEFTVKALALYRQANGGESTPRPARSTPKRGSAPDVSGLDLASIDPVFISYTV